MQSIGNVIHSIGPNDDNPNAISVQGMNVPASDQPQTIAICHQV